MPSDNSNKDKSAATAMARPMPFTAEPAASRSIVSCPRTMLWDMAKIGLINGATSIAPIITAALF